MILFYGPSTLARPDILYTVVYEYSTDFTMTSLQRCVQRMKFVCHYKNESASLFVDIDRGLYLLDATAQVHNICLLYSA